MAGILRKLFNKRKFGYRIYDKCRPLFPSTDDQCPSCGSREFAEKVEYFKEITPDKRKAGKTRHVENRGGVLASAPGYRHSGAGLVTDWRLFTSSSSLIIAQL